jgi:hypothetical protein
MRYQIPLFQALLCAGGCLLLLPAPGRAKPAPAVQLLVREQLNQTYTCELVSYPFEAPKGTCVAESVQVVGPRGPVAAQLSAIEYWPKSKFVKTARLQFLVDELKPLATDAYTVTYGTKTAPAVVSDLRVSRGAESVEVSTSRLGVRLPLGESSFPAPVALNDVPGPYTAMRLGEGAWTGGSAFTGEATVTRRVARLTDAGPAFARVAIDYTFADGNTLTLSALVAAGDSAVRWEMAVRDDQPALGVEFRLPPVPGVTKALLPKGYGQWARDRETPVTAGTTPICSLAPNSSLVNIFVETPPAIRLVGEGGREWQLASRDAGAWVDPVPFTYGGIDKWHLTMIEQSWENWRRKCLPVTYAADGTITLRASLAKGRRLWSVSTGAPLVGERLDRIKELVLDWPQEKAPAHPLLFIDAADYQAPDAKRGPAMAKALDERLALLGNFDVMRYGIQTAGHYDALVDTAFVTPEQRTLYRAQLAYLGYLLADPQCWSMERGFHSGNPNMTLSYTLTLGVIACTLPNHPQAKAWTGYCNRWMEIWLRDDVGANGEWLPEGSHYGYVSLAPMLSYAIAAERAGLGHFLDDPRLKRLIRYFAKTNTPRDAQRKGHRVTGAFGRGTAGDALGVFGQAARMYATRDPEFSKAMQWLWAENGYPVNVGDMRLGGFEERFLQRDLPAAAPVWGSELFPQFGAVLRAGFNTPTESYVTILAAVDSQRNLDVWTPGIGDIAQWFGRGKELSTCFTFDTGYAVRHELLSEGVRLTHNWGQPADTKGPFGYYTRTTFDTFAALPTADYLRAAYAVTHVDTRDWFPDKVPAFPRQPVATAPQLDWTRQLLFLKDADPAGPAYLVLRDTTRGGQPTAWQFWTLSEKVGTPAQAQATDFLADKPGPAILPARELPLSDRYTALGQQGVDVDYFIASPATTPRHTLRYGGVWQRKPEYQDLLHLQQPGDGAYYLALFPRPHADAAPTFTSLAEGKLIKVAGAFGTDYALLSPTETMAVADGVSLRGTAATIQQRPACTTLTLGAAGAVRVAAAGLTAPFAATLQASPDTLVLTLPADHPAGTVRLTIAAGWTVKAPGAGVTLTPVPGGLALGVAKGVTRVELVRGQ